MNKMRWLNTVPRRDQIYRALLNLTTPAVFDQTPHPKRMISYSFNKNTLHLRCPALFGLEGRRVASERGGE